MRWSERAIDLLKRRPTLGRTRGEVRSKTSGQQRRSAADTRTLTKTRWCCTRCRASSRRRSQSIRVAATTARSATETRLRADQAECEPTTGPAQAHERAMSSTSPTTSTQPQPRVRRALRCARAPPQAEARRTSLQYLRSKLPTELCNSCSFWMAVRIVMPNVNEPSPTAGTMSTENLFDSCNKEND